MQTASELAEINACVNIEVWRIVLHRAASLHGCQQKRKSITIKTNNQSVILRYHYNLGSCVSQPTMQNTCVHTHMIQSSQPPTSFHGITVVLRFHVEPVWFPVSFTVCKPSHRQLTTHTTWLQMYHDQQDCSQLLPVTDPRMYNPNLKTAVVSQLRRSDSY